MGTDDDLLVRSAWDSAAFEALVARLSRDVHAYLVRRCTGDAEDLLAATWLEAFASRRRYDRSRGPARAWVFGIARHVLLASYRRAGAAERLGLHLTEDVVDPWPVVDARLDAAAVAPRLRSALRDLSAADREVLLLVAWEQLSPTEAATVVGIPAVTARTRLHRARIRLRSQLAAAEPPAPMTSPRATTEGAQ